MEWLWILFIIALGYIGFDYGRLILKDRRNRLDYEFEPYTPIRNIMISSEKSSHVLDLYTMCVQAHTEAAIDVVSSVIQDGYSKIIFENRDELILYFYDKAKINVLTATEIEDYSQKIFIDSNLPKGAERAVIEQLGLLDYMVNIGICSEKSGGK